MFHLSAIHRHIFQDVYDWAGEIRAVSITKNNQLFALPGFIEREAARIQSQLAGENLLRGLDSNKFVERLAYYFGEWNALHPFREGNGRAIRELLRVMTDNAGYEFDQMAIDNSRNQWNVASACSLNGDLEPIKKIFFKAVRKRRA
ncbi:MAG: Fic/DOC family protein [Burkholderiales bacterium]